MPERIRLGRFKTCPIVGTDLDQMVRRCGSLSRRLLAAFSMSAISAALCVTAWAQSPSPPEFDVASVKPSGDSAGEVSVRTFPGGRLEAKNSTLRELIVNAYQVADLQVSEGPGWIGDQRFDITAKASQESTMQDMLKMFRALLEDRFKLRTHRETKEGQQFALRIAKGGPRLTRKDGTCLVPDGENGQASGSNKSVVCGAIKLGGNNARRTLDGLDIDFRRLVGIRGVLSMIAGRPVTDETQITGRFDIHLHWMPEAAVMSGGLPPSDQGGAIVPLENNERSLFVAIEEQLGLRLEATHGPVDLLVVDYAEKPDPN